MRSQQLQNRFIALMNPHASAINGSLILQHLDNTQDAKEKEKKRYLTLVKLLADYIEFLKKCVPITPNKSLATKLLSNLEALFSDASPGLKNLFPDLKPDSLNDQNFYGIENHFIEAKERDMILVDVMNGKTAITKKLANKNPAADDPHSALFDKISMETKNLNPADSYSASKSFIEKASKHFTSFSDPLIQLLQKNLIGSFARALGSKAELEALHQAGEANTVQNASPFLLAETRRFRSRFGAVWGKLYEPDQTAFNDALNKVNQLDNQPETAQEVSKTIRTKMKSLSRPARWLTRATSLLQESLRLIIKTYVHEQNLTDAHLQQLAGFFLELPFSNKDWGLAYAKLRQNFSRLDYVSKLKVISAALKREEKKEDPSQILTNLIYQAYISRPNEYDKQTDIGQNPPVRLQDLNMKHYNLIKSMVSRDRRKHYLSDHEELFDYKDEAKAKIHLELKKPEILEQNFVATKDLASANVQEITKFKQSLNSEFNVCAKKYKFVLPEGSIETRLQALEERYARLKNDDFSTEQRNALQVLIEKTKLTLEIEKDRTEINSRPALKIFYSELLRSLTINLGAHRAIASGRVERRHVPTVYAGMFFNKLSSLLSMPIVSGALALVGEAIEHSGSFKLKHEADILSKITTTSTNLERLMEKITIKLTKHLQDELQKYDSESAKRVAHFCEERCIALILIHRESEDWSDLDRTAEKYVGLITEKIAPDDSMLDKVRMIFHNFISLGISKLKLADGTETQKTIAEMVTERPYKSLQNNPKTAAAKSQEQGSNLGILTNALPTVFVQAETEEEFKKRILARLAQQDHIIEKLTSRVSELESEKNEMKKEAAAKGEELAKMQETLAQLNSQVNALNDEKQKMKQEATAKDAGLVELQEQLASRVNNVELDQEAKQSEIEALKNQVLQLQTENAGLKDMLGEKERLKAALRREQAALHEKRAVTFTTPLRKQADAAVEDAVASSSDEERVTSFVTPSSSPQKKPAAESTEDVGIFRQTQTFAAAVNARRSQSKTDIAAIRRNLANELEKTTPRKIAAVATEDTPTKTKTTTAKNKNLIKLVSPFNELLTTEASFCQPLKKLTDNFTESMKNPEEKAKLVRIIGPDRFEHISEKMKNAASISQNPFLNFEIIDPDSFPNNEALLAHFRAQISQIFAIFENINLAAARIELFEDILSDQDQVIAEASNPRCSSIFNSWAPSPADPKAKATFETYYGSIFQRPARYKLIFQEMLNICTKLESEANYLPGLKEISVQIRTCVGDSHIYTKLAEPKKLEYSVHVVDALPNDDAVMIRDKVYVQIAGQNLNYKLVGSDSRLSGYIKLSAIVSRCKRDPGTLTRENIHYQAHIILDILKERAVFPKPTQSSSGVAFFKLPKSDSEQQQVPSEFTLGAGFSSDTE